jgi:NADPH:quinone reductase-like Zn-dependent oxidoreductase
MGTDGAGIVEAIGPAVTNVKKGDIVVMHGDLFDASTATFQQYAKTEAELMAKVPPNITVEQASTLPVAIAAVFVGFYHSTGLSLTPPWIHGGIGKYKGQGIFIAGGASSVGQFGIRPDFFAMMSLTNQQLAAIQLAKLSGFTIATTASEPNHALVTSLGATHVFPRSSSAANIKSATGPIKFGFDAIANPDTQALSLQVLEKTEESTLIIVKQPTEGTKKDAAPIKARWILGSSVRTRDISVPFWAAVEGWLKDGES